jgi:hypothetical protein
VAFDGSLGQAVYLFEILTGFIVATINTSEECMSKIAERTVEYSYDSARLVGYFCTAEATQNHRPGVVIVHDAFGVSDFMKSIAREWLNWAMPFWLPISGVMERNPRKKAPSAP